MKIIALVKQILDPAGISVRRDKERVFINKEEYIVCLLYTSPSPRDRTRSRMTSSA